VESKGMESKKHGIKDNRCRVKAEGIHIVITDFILERALAIRDNRFHIDAGHCSGILERFLAFAITDFIWMTDTKSGVQVAICAMRTIFSAIISFTRDHFFHTRLCLS